MKAMIEIRAAGAPPIRRALDRDALTIGRAPRHGLAIPQARDLADEHLIISVQRDRFHVALAPGARIEPTLHGRPFRQADVAFGDEIVIGKTSIRFTGQAKSNAPSPIVVGGGLLVVGLLVWMAVQGSGEALSGSQPPAPSLFPAQGACPDSGASAIGRASELEQAAMARAERYNFDVHDGVEAVLLYLNATACFTAGGDAARAARSARELDLWRTRLNQRYQAHQLRLRLALDRGNRVAARDEIIALTKILRGARGPYVDWLTLAAREFGSTPIN